MTSLEAEKLMEENVRGQIDLYRQLREQLVHEVERYRSQGRDRLADIISESLRE
jgi:hypothetical protein